MSVQSYFKVSVDNDINNEYLFECPQEAIEIANTLHQELGGRVVVFGFNRYQESDPTPMRERVLFWEYYSSKF